MDDCRGITLLRLVHCLNVRARSHVSPKRNRVNNESDWVSSFNPQDNARTAWWNFLSVWSIFDANVFFLHLYAFVIIHLMWFSARSLCSCVVTNYDTFYCSANGFEKKKNYLLYMSTDQLQKIVWFHFYFSRLDFQLKRSCSILPVVLKDVRPMNPHSLLEMLSSQRVEYFTTRQLVSQVNWRLLSLIVFDLVFWSRISRISLWQNTRDRSHVLLEVVLSLDVPVFSTD